jgi:hsp70-interacting protein
MKEILHEVTQQIEVWKLQSETNGDRNIRSDGDDNDDDDSVNTMLDLLQELRDIVEQIDYARAFTSMKGVVFLLGCIENKENIHLPMKIRQFCCAIIATLCQHNPPVQKECIELGALKMLYTVLCQASTNGASNKDNALFCERIIQAISAIVRSYDLAESIFCQLEQANDIFRLGLVGDNTDVISVSSPPLNVRKRTLFFLRALLTSDTTSIQRIQLFQSHIVYVIDNILLLPKEDSNVTIADDEIVEMALGMIQQLLEQRISVNAILSRKHALVATAVQRISALRKQQVTHDNNNDNHNDGGAELLETWERILSLLADAKPDPPILPVNE